MKSEFSIRGKLLAGLILVLFSATAVAQTPMKPTWVKEGVDWSQYSKFIVKPLNIEDVVLIPPPWAERPEEWELNMDSFQTIKSIYRDVMKAELGYPVVYVPGRDVLEINVEIVSVTPWLRPNEGGSMEGAQAMTMGTGELSASVEIRDSKTRELLWMVAGVGTVGDQYKEFTRENNARNVEKMFKNFAHSLRTAMDLVHGK